MALAIKIRPGRIGGEPLLSACSEIVGDMNAFELPIDAQDAFLNERLPAKHRDPFDRATVAQVLRPDLAVATRDGRVLVTALTV